MDERIEITVQGYKSIREAHTVEMRPLTILAGANSSGKSSLMQPLLLLKQTLEATYDPGPLLLSGPHVRFNKAEQMFNVNDRKARLFRIGLRIGSVYREVTFRKDGRLEVASTVYEENGARLEVTPSVARKAVEEFIEKVGLYEGFSKRLRATLKKQEFSVNRNRCFLETSWIATGFEIESLLRSIIHLPGLRGNPERSYVVTAVEDIAPATLSLPAFSMFHGTFEPYTASLIARWQESAPERLAALTEDLVTLELTWKVEARRLDDTRVELRVGRLKKPKRGGAQDLVNIADVGFGVSQTLPLLVALHAASPSQMIYVEQPEIHLHPRAQVKLAEVLAAAAERGAQVVVETHSALLLLAVQTLVAEGKLSPSLVKLHWFTRDEKGETHITSADLDEDGAFGDWAEDFGSVELEAQARYLDAVERRRAQHG